MNSIDWPNSGESRAEVPRTCGEGEVANVQGGGALQGRDLRVWRIVVTTIPIKLRLRRVCKEQVRCRRGGGRVYFVLVAVAAVAGTSCSKSILPAVRVFY